MPKNVRLKAARRSKGFTQFQVADAVGINPQYYSMIERGTRTPGFHLAGKLSDLLGVPVDELFFDQEPNKTFEAEQAS